MPRGGGARSRKNPLARYELGKALVAKGECADARKEMDRFRALPEVKAEAKEHADAIVKACRKAP